jgi:N-carbamoyl-L-amino-acid hydrolase
MINCFGMPWNRLGTLGTRRSIIMDSVKNFRIDPDRLWDSLMEMAKIGPGVAGGNNRQTLTDEDAEGRSLFETWCKDAGNDYGGR